MWVVDVPAEPILAPGGGLELHRSLCARGARAPDAVEVRLHEVHRREHVPRDAEAALRLPVEVEQPPGGSGRPGLEVAGGGPGRRGAPGAPTPDDRAPPPAGT